MILKKIINKLSYLFFLCKCEFFYASQGGPGFCYVIEHLPPAFIIRILKRYGAKIGDHCQIDTGLTIHRIKQKEELNKLTIGNNVYIGHRMVLDLTESITIENHCAFGGNCQIWTHTGNWTIDRRDEKDVKNPVLIKTAVIVYSACIISQGVTIGNYSRVAAGSVVTKNIKDNCFVGGIPAKFIKTRDL